MVIPINSHVACLLDKRPEEQQLAAGASIPPQPMKDAPLQPSDFPPNTMSKMDDWSIIHKTQARKAQFHCTMLKSEDSNFLVTILINLIMLAPSVFCQSVFKMYRI